MLFETFQRQSSGRVLQKSCLTSMMERSEKITTFNRSLNFAKCFTLDASESFEHASDYCLFIYSVFTIPHVYIHTFLLFFCKCAKKRKYRKCRTCLDRNLRDENIICRNNCSLIVFGKKETQSDVFL